MVTFNKPAAGSAIQWENLLGRLLLIYPTRIEADVDTSVGTKDAIVADVHVLDGPDPEVIKEAFIFPRLLQAQLRPSIGGDPVIGRLTQGAAKKGQNPPWKLDDATDKDEAVATAHVAQLAEDPPF